MPSKYNVPGVYALVFPAGRFYVGSSTYLNRRRGEHLYTLRLGRNLCRMDPGLVEDGVPDWQHGFSVGFQSTTRYEVVPVALEGSPVNPKVNNA